MLQDQSLQEAVKDYIENYCIAEQDMAEGTVRNKRYILGELLKFLQGEPLSLKTVLSFRLEMYKKWKTPNGKADITRELRAIINWLARREYIEKSFAEGIEKPKVPQAYFPYIAPEMVVEIIIAGTKPESFVFGKSGDNTRNRLIKHETRLGLFFILLTGLRIGELTKLKVSDLYFYEERPICYIHSKGGDVDKFPIPENMVQVLKQIAKKKTKNERVFKITRKTCNIALERGAKKLGMDVRLTNHDLRRIFGTHLAKEGVVAQLIQKAMRHKDIATTMKYYINLDITDTANVINRQRLVRNSLQTQDKIEMVEKEIKKLGFQNDPMLDIDWQRLANGGFTLTITPREIPRTDVKPLALEQALQESSTLVQ